MMWLSIIGLLLLLGMMGGTRSQTRREPREHYENEYDYDGGSDCGGCDE